MLTKFALLIKLKTRVYTIMSPFDWIYFNSVLDSQTVVHVPPVMRKLFPDAKHAVSTSLVEFYI